MRSESLEVHGGGNTANALTCASRLGLRATLLTKIGSDGIGDEVIKELERDGVGVEFVMRAEGCSTPFTYIIVDKGDGTRTCIHSPSPGTSLSPEDITAKVLEPLLDGARLVFFDGRLTEAALVVAARAKDLGIPILVEGERPRARLDELLAYADVIVTSKNFPCEFIGSRYEREGDTQAQAEAIAATFRLHPLARVMITTLGSKGSVLLIRDESVSDDKGGQPQEEEREPRRLGDVLKELEGQLGPPPSALDIGEDGSKRVVEIDCTTRNGVRVIRGSTAYTPESVVVRGGEGSRIKCWVVRSAAASVYNNLGEKDDSLIVDTTGAGDAFIGAVVHCLAQLVDVRSPMLLERARQILWLSGVVAAAQCTEVGSRPGLPFRKRISDRMF